MTYLTMKGFNKTTPPRLPLCFTANSSSSTVQLIRTGTASSITLETSSDGSNWNTYTIWDTITLSNIWDKVYFRNKSETDTLFSTSTSNFFNFVMTWSIAGSWDVTSLINKNWTDTLSAYCFVYLFIDCTALTTSPKMPVTTIDQGCCQWMFNRCTWLTDIVKLDANTLYTNCYRNMYTWCTNIKLSSTQTWEYQTEYRIPTTWTWTTWTNSLYNMFSSTWWLFTWTPAINTTYYTSNTVV